MSGLRLLLLILAIITFGIVAILGLASSTTAITVNQLIGVTGIGLGLFAASFLPIP